MLFSLMISELGGLSQIDIDLPDPVELHTEGGEAGVLVDGQGDLSETVVMTVH